MKTTLKSILAAILITAITITGIGIGKSPIVNAESEQVVAFKNNGTLSMNVGDTQKLSYITEDSNGMDYYITDKCEWISSNKKVATVELNVENSYVKVKAIASGTAKISAKKNGRSLLEILVSVRSIPMNMTITARETTVNNASKGCTLLGLDGKYERVTKKKILNRINEIRYEACKKGYPDPRNPKRKLTTDDYVPVKWSSDLEWIAQIRAAEATVNMSHERPNGRTSYSVTHNGIMPISEDLAWNGSGIMYGIEQWYREKNDWVKQNTNKTTGHYTNLMSPDITYAAISGFAQGSSKDYAIAGTFVTDKSVIHDITDSIYEFLGKNNYSDWDDSDWIGIIVPDRPDGLDSLEDLYRLYGVKTLEELKELKSLKLPQKQSSLKGQTIQTIEVLSSSLGKGKLDAPKSIKKGKKKQLFVTRKISFSTAQGDSNSAGIVLDVKWKSSKESIISIKKDGTITAKKAGKAIITATFGKKTLKKTICVTK